MKYKTILFDLDGTLLNTLDDLIDAANHELLRCGYPQRTREEIRMFLGNGYRALMQSSLPEGCSEEEVDSCTASMRSYYYEHSCHRTKPYPGIPELLQLLRTEGVAVGVVSNKMDEAVKKLCEHYLPGLVDIAVGEMEGIARKPSPDTVEYALKMLQAAKEDAVYVGDSEVDIATSKNAGLPCVVVSWGFRDKETLKDAGADTIAETTEDLLFALQQRIGT